MPAIHSRKRSRILNWCITLLVVGIAGGILARPYAARVYHRWSAQRHVQKASDFLAQGDPRHALLEARSALVHSGRDVEAIRIAAQSLEAIGAPEADEWRAQLDTLQPHDPENTLARARTALKITGATGSQQLLDTLDPADRKGAPYHAVAAAIAFEKNDTAAAESHWAEAARLEPEEKAHRLNLISMRLESKTPGVREGALAALQEMRGDPATGVEALRQLLADAIRRREAIQAREFADALVADKRCTFSDKLTRLSTLRMIHDARSSAYLLELRDAAVANPAELFTLLMWMNANELSLMVAEWVRWMPQELIARAPVSLGVADAYMRIADWAKLEELTGTAKWGEMDFMRKAFLACALEHLDEDADAAKEWADAVSAVRGRADAMERLAKFAVQAKWTKRAQELKWTLAAMPKSPRWVLDSLWKDAYQRGDTAQLQKLSGAQAKADPKGLASRNNYAFLSLLTRNTEDNPHGIAETLYREHPEDGLVASTYALSLFQQGKAADAAALMSALKPEQLRQPQVALYHAIFLLANGQAEKAQEYLKLSAEWPMLPEEKALLDRVTATSAKTTGSAQGRSETDAPAPVR